MCRGTSGQTWLIEQHPDEEEPPSPCASSIGQPRRATLVGIWLWPGAASPAPVASTTRGDRGLVERGHPPLGQPAAAARPTLK